MLVSPKKTDTTVIRDPVLARKVALAVRGIWILYAVAGMATLVFNALIAVGQCDGTVKCGLAIGKVILSTVFWPFFWMLHTNGFA